MLFLLLLLLVWFSLLEVLLLYLAKAISRVGKDNYCNVSKSNQYYVRASRINIMGRV